MTKAIEFKNITKSYDNLPVIKNTSFEVNEGEITCLLGPSGSGKTTLFKLAAAIINPDQGKISYKEGLRKSYVFQSPRLLPWKTVEENIIFAQENYLNEDKAKKIREELLELNGLGDFKSAYPSQLSGGMKQRVEIIRALAIWPDLLLLDEPFKSVDTQLKLNLRKMLLRFYEKMNLSVLLITHDPEEAVLLADKIYILGDEGANIKKEFTIDKTQQRRKLSDKEIYNIVQDIISIFMEIVDDYRWDKNEKTEEIFEKMKGR
ncbi:MAG: ABC transporter ATP-binding protein [Bacillota bacterium]